MMNDHNNSALTTQDALELHGIFPQNYLEEVIAATAKNPEALLYTSDAFRNDKEAVMAAVAQNLLALQYASISLRKDKEVAIAAIMKNALVGLQCASTDLRKDEEVMMSAIAQNPLTLQHAANVLKNDLEIVMSAIAQAPLAIKYASLRVKDNPKAVIAAVAQNPLAIEYASLRLRNNPKLVMDVIEQNPLSIKYTSLQNAWKCLKNKTKSMIDRIRNNPQILNIASGNLFAKITAHNITKPQKLCLESMIAKIFFKEYGLYIKAQALMQYGALSYYNISTILGFLFPQYINKNTVFAISSITKSSRVAFPPAKAETRMTAKYTKEDITSTEAPKASV